MQMDKEQISNTEFKNFKVSYRSATELKYVKYLSTLLAAMEPSKGRNQNDTG